MGLCVLRTYGQPRRNQQVLVMKTSDFSQGRLKPPIATLFSGSMGTCEAPIQSLCFMTKRDFLFSSRSAQVLSGMHSND